MKKFGRCIHLQSKLKFIKGYVQYSYGYLGKLKKIVGSILSLKLKQMAERKIIDEPKIASVN